MKEQIEYSFTIDQKIIKWVPNIPEGWFVVLGTVTRGSGKKLLWVKLPSNMHYGWDGDNRCVVNLAHQPRQK